MATKQEWFLHEDAVHKTSIQWRLCPLCGRDFSENASEGREHFALHMEDIAMSSVLTNPAQDDSGYADNDDSREMRALQDPSRSSNSVGEEATAATAGRIMQRSNTVSHVRDDWRNILIWFQVMVCDQRLLLSDLDLFDSLIEHRWSIVIPHQGKRSYFSI